MSHDFWHRVVVPARSSISVVFPRPRGFKARRVMAKVVRRGCVLLTGIWALESEDVLELTNLDTFDRAIQLGLSDRVLAETDVNS